MARAARLRRNRAELEPWRSDFAEPRRCQLWTGGLTHCSDDRCRGDQGHEVSILIVIGVAVGRYRGVEPSLWIDIIELACRNQGIDGGCAVPSGIGARKCPIAAADNAS